MVSADSQSVFHKKTTMIPARYNNSLFRTLSVNVMCDVSLMHKLPERLSDFTLESDQQF